MEENSTATPRPQSNQALNWLINFSGIVILILTLPLFILNLWSVSIIVTIVLALAFVGYALLKGRKVGSLDVVWLTFGVINAVLYFGFKNTILLQHLDTLIYTVLLAMIVLSLIQRRPWTEQYARRTTPPEFWETKAFHSINFTITVVWGIAFLLCDLVSLLLDRGSRAIVEAVILVVVAVMTPTLGRLLARRFQTKQNAG